MANREIHFSETALVILSPLIPRLLVYLACLLSGLVGIEEQQREHISVNVLVISVAAVLLKA